MSYQNISYAMPQADVDTIKAAISTIQSAMPFLVTMSGDEIRSLMKLGPKSADFVQDAAQAAVNFSNILPASFNMEEYAKDTDLFRKLMEVKLLIDSLSEKIDNTYVAVGSEAMTSSLEVYAYVQTATTHTPGLQSVADKLKDRFRKQSAKQTSTIDSVK